MFTGIIQAVGRIASSEVRSFGRRLVVDIGEWRPPGLPIAHGDSICVSGVCLTVVEFLGNELAFDVIPETLEKTTLGALAPGDAVNLEGSLTAQQPLGGHFVQGHVEGVGQIQSVQQGEDWRITIAPPASLMPCIIPKGSITVDGVSMTIASVTRDAFDIAVIPTTRRLTTLGHAAVGVRVNIETDILVRSVVQTLTHLRGAASTS